MRYSSYPGCCRRTKSGAALVTSWGPVLEKDENVIQRYSACWTCARPCAQSCIATNRKMGNDKKPGITTTKSTLFTQIPPWGWRCSSVPKYLTSMSKTLGFDLHYCNRHTQTHIPHAHRASLVTKACQLPSKIFKIIHKKGPIQPSSWEPQKVQHEQ